MASIGSSRLSLRQGGPWQGMNLLSRSGPGRLLLLENGYVNSDGTEVRMMPGYRCVIDPETQARNITTDTTVGYRATHVDARRNPNIAFPGNAYYTVDNSAPAETMQIWTEPGLMHGVEQVHGRWIFYGESDYRREPIFNAARTAFVSVQSFEDNGINITITVNTAPDTSTTAFNAIADNDRVTFDGVTGSLATLLNGKSHRIVSPPAGATLVISTTSGGVVALTPSTGNISRVQSNSRNTLGVSNDAFSDLTIWTSLAKGDPDAAPSELVRCAHVANRVRDFGDIASNLKEGNQNAATSRQGVSRRRSIGLPYRVVSHVAGNRLIFAVPGYGCVMQAPVVIPPGFGSNDTADGVGALCNDIYDRPRALGVPKAVVWEDPSRIIDPLNAGVGFHVHAPAVPGVGVPDKRFGGSDVASRAGTYQFKFAYMDEGTGEIGLTSEPIIVTTDASTARQGFRFWIYFPGYLLHESLATSINVYRTTKGGKTFYFDRTIPMYAANSNFTQPADVSSRYGVQPESSTAEYFFHVHYEALYIDDTELTKQLNPVPEVIEQMPMGCKAARTIRGYTFFGGALGDAGSRKEMFKGTSTFEYDPASALDSIYPNHDELTFMHTNDATPTITSGVEGAESWFMCGARRIPPAYAGQTVIGRDVGPSPRKSLDLDLSVNTEVGWQVLLPLDRTGRIPDVRFTVVDTPVSQSESFFDSSRRAVATYLKLPRARLQISEPDNPNIVPALNTTLLANEIDDDIEGIGDAGGQAVICTKVKTYMLGFSQSPIQVPPSVADERFGCIAPNSMVSFGSGCAWISDRGPVAFVGGSVAWIGEPLAPMFMGETAIYKRDGDGMMRHSWACHDAERSLLYFGVFSDRNAGTALETQITYAGSALDWEFFRGASTQDLAWSKFPCDEVLVFSYRTGAWSVWKPPLAIQWMTNGLDADGTNRVFFLGQDRRLYVLDDNWAQGDKEVWSLTATANQTTSTINTSLAHIPSWLGLTVAVVRTTSGIKTIVGTATVTAEVRTGADTDITLSAPITIKVGDVIQIGCRSMRLRTTYINLKQSDSSQVPAAVASFSLDSRLEAGGSGPYDAFASARIVTAKVRDGIPTKSDQSLNADDPSSYSWLGSHLADDPVRDKKLAQGQAVGQNHMLDLTVLGNAQVRMQDMFMEVG